MEEEKKKAKLYERWQFWACLLGVLAIIGILTGEGNKNNELLTSTSNIASEYHKQETPTPTPEETEEQKQARLEQERKAKEELEAQYKASCQVYTYEQIARNPDNYKNVNMKLTGKVVQVIRGDYATELRVNITKYGTYSTYYKDTIYITYLPTATEERILEDDIITIYGAGMGEQSYKSTLGAKITLPWVHAKYIIIEK